MRDVSRPLVGWMALAAALGIIAGCYPIANTSIGWHLASGHWILDQESVPTSDPFTFSSGQAPWIDHEWLFQVVVAAVETVGGATALTILRALMVAAMAVLLFFLGRRGGLSPPAALVLTALCLYGARIRFFLRPELATLLIAPTVIWLFISRAEGSLGRRIAAILVLMALGANLHGGILVVPPLLAGILAAQTLQWLLKRSGPSPVVSGAACLAAATGAPLLNPYGWRLYAVPLEIAHLVGLDHIPNPEWISPTFSDVPPLYVAMGLGLVALALAERRLARWVLLVMAAALALRYVRNVGLFFMLYPIAVAPAFASLPLLARGGRLQSRPALRTAAVAVAVVVVTAMALLPGRAPGLGFSDRYYPDDAWAFIQRQRLADIPAYNDVRFGGFLIRQHYPERKTFLDDRNEIHEPLLAEVHAILGSSDPGAWQAMLDRYGIDLALVRYHPTFRVFTPDGKPAGRRGFSALWFPESRWALIHWDDVAMVLIERAAADPELLARYEYRVIRPDDVEELQRRAARDPTLRRAAAEELARKLSEQPDSGRALEISRRVLGTGP